jgi:ferredoxin
MQASKSLLETLSFPMQNYAQESFGAAPKPKPPAAKASPEPPQVSTPSSTSSTLLFSSAGKQTEHDGSESVLELAEQLGVKIRSGCRQGVCGACKKRKLEGEVRYNIEPDALEPSDRDAGCILTCVAFPVGKVVVEA